MPERKVTISTVAPANPNVGDSWIHPTTRVEKIWKGTLWEAVMPNLTQEKIWVGNEGDRPKEGVKPGAQLVIAETEVFNGAAPGAWTDLVLSGTIGTNPALVLLKIDGAVDLNATAVRKKGDTDEFCNAAAESNAYGCALGHHEAGVHLVLIVATDANGVIQWMVEDPGNATVDIIAYIK